MKENGVNQFDYQTAFSRNIGWVTHNEQHRLQHCRIAIGGMGGVGGSHLLTLTRLGIGKFHLADFDRFELANFNRQAGASMPHLGKDKVTTLADMALAINPELNIRLFPEGVTEQNIDQFLEGVDLYIDGLDFFAVTARRAVFAACQRLRIPAVTAAPLGMGAAVLNFLPGKMSFEEYFQLNGVSENEQLVRFIMGLSPAMLQRGYLADPSAVNFLEHRGPSTAMACELCAGVAATEALKILLRRPNVRAAPHGAQFDAYRQRLAHTWRPWGNRNPLQKIGIAIATRQLAHMAAHPRIAEPQPQSIIEKILDLAKWAPSGDNVQPWRFEICNEHHVIVHGYDEREACIYDRLGHASQFSVGALAENVAIAASQFGWQCHFDAPVVDGPSQFHISVRFTEQPGITPDPLLGYIKSRATQRRAMSTRRITEEEKSRLNAALGPHFRLVWFEDFNQRLMITRHLCTFSHLRLTLRETYDLHRTVIDWNQRYSNDKMPDLALGSSRLALLIMRWTMKSWKRIDFLNRYLAGTLLPHIELDIIPGLACGAHFIVTAKQPPQTLSDHIASGRAIQRFWLTATALGLSIQPEMMAVIFNSYIAHNVAFSHKQGVYARAEKMTYDFAHSVGDETARTMIFMGRIGAGPAPDARSLRRPLHELLKR